MTKSSRDFPHVFVLPKMKSQLEADQWCEQQFGPKWEAIGNRQGVWCCFWKGRGVPGSYEWMFQNKRDATLFILKWS